MGHAAWSRPFPGHAAAQDAAAVKAYNAAAAKVKVARARKKAKAKAKVLTKMLVKDKSKALKMLARNPFIEVTAPPASRKKKGRAKKRPRKNRRRGR